MKALNPAAVYAAIIRGCPAMKPAYGKQPYGIEALQRETAGRYGGKRDVVEVRVEGYIARNGEAEYNKARALEGALDAMVKKALEELPEEKAVIEAAIAAGAAKLREKAKQVHAASKAEGLEGARAKAAKVKMALESVRLEVLSMEPNGYGLHYELKVARKVEVAA